MFVIDGQAGLNNGLRPIDAFCTCRSRGDANETNINELCFVGSAINHSLVTLGVDLYARVITVECARSTRIQNKVIHCPDGRIPGYAEFREGNTGDGSACRTLTSREQSVFPESILERSIPSVDLIVGALLWGIMRRRLTSYCLRFYLEVG